MSPGAGAELEGGSQEGGLSAVTGGMAAALQQRVAVRSGGPGHLLLSSAWQSCLPGSQRHERTSRGLPPPAVVHLSSCPDGGP